MKNKGLEGLVNHVVGKNIKSIRDKNDLNQMDLAELLGVNFQQIKKYENGKNRISAPSLFLLSQKLRVHREVFFYGIAFHFEGEKK
jgi:transcriptional regulator with XRE-family HTH domain